MSSRVSVGRKEPRASRDATTKRTSGNDEGSRPDRDRGRTCAPGVSHDVVHTAVIAAGFIGASGAESEIHGAKLCNSLARHERWPVSLFN